MRVVVALAALAAALALLLPAAAPAPAPADGARRGRGVAMEPPVNLSNSPGVASGRPQIARTSDGTLHVIWEEGPDVRHLFNKPGTAWGTTPADTVYYRADTPALVAERDQLAAAVVIQAGQATDTLIRVKSWEVHDGVGKWGKNQAVTEAGQYGQQQPDIAIQPDDGSLWVAWVNNRYGYQPYISHIVAGQNPKVGPVGQDSQKAQGPSVAVDAEGGVWVAWKEEAEPSNDSWVTCRRLPPGGNWGLCNERTDVLRGETYQAFAPDLALGSSGACLTWHNVMVSRSADVYLACDGSNWSARNISQTPDRNSLLPRLALEKLWGPLVTWEERGAPRSILNRPGLSPPTAVAQGDSVAAPSVVFEPLAAQGYGYLHTVWEGVNPADPAGENDVYYTRYRVDVPTPTPTPTATPTATRTPSPTPTATAGTPTLVTPTAGTPGPRRVFAPFVAKPLASRTP